MPQAVRQAAKPAAVNLLEQLCDGAVALRAKIQQNRERARNRAALDELSDAQLEAVGIDRWAGLAPRPVMEVEAGLITNLMSMR